MKVTYKLRQYPDYEYETGNFYDLCDLAYNLFMNEPLIGIRLCLKLATPDYSSEYMFFNTIVGNVLDIHFERQFQSADNLYRLYDIASASPFLDNQVSFIGGSYVFAPNGSLLIRDMFFGPYGSLLRHPVLHQLEFSRGLPKPLNVPWAQEGF